MSSEVSRRTFLKLTGTVAAGVGVVGAGNAEAAPPAQTRTTLPYPAKVVGSAAKLQVDAPQSFTYPDAASPCTLVKTGKPVPGGVGPDADIVAYSNLCTHMGCPVNYDASERVFKCPCHFSLFDAELSGQMICGQATENLPQIELRYSAKDGSISAVSVNGLIYGRQSNLI
jgi:arsenite oxidase small subunit